MRFALALSAAFVLACLSVVIAVPAGADTLYFTRVGGPVVRAHYAYDGHGHFTFDQFHDIASPDSGGDGLIWTPDSKLLVGGQGLDYALLDPFSGQFTIRTCPNSTGVAHLALDPTENFAWGSYVPGSLCRIPLKPFGNASAHDVTGDEDSVTSLAFVGSKTFYTSSGPGGNGSFGTINMKTFVTHRIYANIPAAHGMVYDPYTRNLVLFGSAELAQINPSNASIVSKLDFMDPAIGELDQGTVDGEGHAFAADNNGSLAFVDYAHSRRVGATTNFVKISDAGGSMDDVAPLVGLGAPCRDRIPPYSRFTRARTHVTTRGFSAQGRSRDRGCGPKAEDPRDRGKVVKVYISVALQKHGLCHPLDSHGHFLHARSCKVPFYAFRAKGRERWSISRRFNLPHGLYRLFAKAYDARLNREQFDRRQRNGIYVRG
jgi:hypothetical protein